MKKLISFLAAILVVSTVNSQSLEEIMKKHSAANKFDKLSSMQTIKITAKMSMMGMEFPMVLWMKNPDKIKTVMNINGQEMISAFDGTKGYTVNPMSGSADPAEMKPEEIKQILSSNIFKNQMETYLKEGKLTLDGEENVNDKPAFRIKANLDGGNTATMFIDKSSYLLTKQTTMVSAQGQTITVDSYPTDYKEINGVIMPMKTTASSPMGEMVTTISNVEVNVPMEDSVFTIKK